MQNTPYLIPWFISVTLTFFMGVIAIRRRGHFAAIPFIAMCFFATLWAFGYIFELGSSSLAVKFAAVKIEYIGIIGVPLSWTAFALAYSGEGQWLTKRNITLALIFPVITLLVLWTNEYHYWFFTEVGATTDPISGLLLIWNPPGWWFWLHAFYVYAILVFGSYFLFREYWNQRAIYRSQAVVNMVAILLPWIANGIVIFRLSPVQIDITSVTFSLSILILGWGFFRYGLLDIVPVAHRAVFESISDAVIVLDPTLRIVELNPAAADLFKLQPNSIIGKFFQDILHMRLHLDETSLRQHGYHKEIVVHIGNEPDRWLDVSISALHDSSNRQGGHIVTLRDVTSLKENEAALAIARDEAVRANNFKTQLLANVSHELRTPLGIIMGYTDLLSRNSYGEMNGKQISVLGRVRESTEYLDKLVSELLDQAQLDSGKLKLAETSFEIREVLGKTCNQLSVLAEAKNLEFSAVISEDMPISIVGDSQRLKQILINLISNAIKFTETGGVSVRIYKSSPAEWIMQVRDTGPGIPRESMHMVFESFKQLPEASKIIRKGYGLGLSITKQLITLMNGSITVESKVGQGTTFTITLPLVEEKEPAS
ncbi:MAG: histidine kinase N-terminal 7TM domain-containing protein [Anaerolineales bacterium]|nr:histidine kinase N-terminal 7TM domain-containing protein [Anaerolineales bacterium]